MTNGDLPEQGDAPEAVWRGGNNEQVIEGQRRALELALHGAPLSAVLEVIVETVELQSTSGVLGSILLLGPDGKLRQGAAPSLPDPYNAAIDGLQIGPDVGSCGTAAFTGKTVVVSDIETDPRWVHFKAAALPHGLRACWSTPIFSSQGQVLGTFALYHRTPTTPSSRDRHIVRLLGTTAALVIERERESRRRAAAEAALQQERDQQLAKVAAMFEHAPAAIAMLRGPEHVFEFVNPRYAQLVGGRPLLGRSIRQALPELDGQGPLEWLDEAARTGEAYVGRSQRVVLPATDPGGAPEEAFFDFVYQPVPGDDGKTAGILVIAFDVTELARAKLEAEAARARAEASEYGFRMFIENLPELAWTARPDGDIDYFNRRWYEYTGTSYEDLQGWGWERVLEPDRVAEIQERWRESLATGASFEMEFTLRGADGTPRWFLTRVAALRDPSGKIVRWFGTSTDIHDVKTAQALSIAMTEQSRETERILLDMRAAKERAEQRIAELEERSALSPP